MSESKWATIQDRQALHDFPCVPEGCDSGRVEIHFCASGLTTDCEIEDVCPLRPIYKEYMRLRAVVEAVLGNSTPEAEAARARRFIKQFGDVGPLSDFNYAISAKAWEAIA